MTSKGGSWTPGGDCVACGMPDDACNLNLEVGDRTACCAGCHHPAVAAAGGHTWDDDEDGTATGPRRCVVCRFPEPALVTAGMETDCRPGLAALHHAAHAEGRADGIREGRARSTTGSATR